MSGRKRNDPMDPSEVDVAANIRAETARRGWTQSQLAKHLGMTAASVNRRWWGKDLPWTIGEMTRAASLFGMRPSALLECAARDSNPEPSGSERDPHDCVTYATSEVDPFGRVAA